MTNQQIIASVAVEKGIYTAQEIEEMCEAGRDIPLHTLQGWHARKYRVKKGEHGIETRLWKKKSGKNATDQDEEESVSPADQRNFYLTKAYLFTADQVEEDKTE